MAPYNYILNDNINYIEIDYMRGSILLSSCLPLWILIYNLWKRNEMNLNISLIPVNNGIKESNKGKNNNELSILNLIKNWNINILSAENIKGFSETICQSSNDLDKNKLTSNIDCKNQFIHWFAGVIDGDGYIQVRKINGKKKISTIEVKLHNRDIRILNTILNNLHIGRIYRYKSNPYSKWIVSDQENIKKVMILLNGLIRIKVDTFKLGCECLGIDFYEADYNIQENDSYFSGLIDTDGSIVFNWTGNRIECNLELKYNEYTKKLNLDNVIKNYKPNVLIRNHKLSLGKTSQSIKFNYQTVNGMIYLYNYFMKNRLYSDIKFYRISKIISFIEIRKYKKSAFDSEEYLIYSEFLLNFIKYLNPKWDKVPFVSKLRMKR